MEIAPVLTELPPGAMNIFHLFVVKSLPKILTKLQDMGVHCLGFSEHAKGSTESKYQAPATCLIFGAEETGMSFAVQRILQNTVAIDPQGPISSLNVSVAAAVAMEKYFSN